MNISITDVKPEELENVYNFLSRFFSKPEEVVLPKPVRPEDVPATVKEKIESLNSTPVQKINWVRLTEFCKKMNINMNTVTNAARNRHCFACKKVGKYLYIDENAATKYYSRGRVYTPIRNSAPSTQAVTPYIEWRDEIFEKIDKTPYSRNQILSRLYAYMTKNYGIVWEQISKECRRRTGKVMTATIWLAWYWETEIEPKHRGLTSACLDTVIAEREREWNTLHEIQTKQKP